MQSLVFYGTRDLRLEDAPPPATPPDEVLIEVTACGVCGSDVHGFLGHSARRSANTPLVMGHELTGRIASVGAGVESLTEGTRVTVQPELFCGRCPACRSGRQNICPRMIIIGIERPGAFARFLSVPAHRVFPLPDEVDDVEGALCETLAVQVHLFRQMAPPLLRTVVITGAGPQGLLALQLARLAGATQVIVSDVVPARLALAEKLGADHVVKADVDDLPALVRTATDGWGAEFVVDTAGMPQSRRQGAASLAPGGTMVCVGLGLGETELNFLPLINWEHVVRGSYCYNDDDFQRAIELLAGGGVQAAPLVTAAPLAEGVAWFQRLVEHPEAASKVVLFPAEG